MFSDHGSFYSQFHHDERDRVPNFHHDVRVVASYAVGDSGPQNRHRRRTETDREETRTTTSALGIG